MRSPVHPRVCGERLFRQPRQGGANGSSPRVRGTQDGAPDEKAVNRFIPACAGNAWPGHPAPPASPVHPRVCGERRVDGAMTPCIAGSSPRVRGTR